MADNITVTIEDEPITIFFPDQEVTLTLAQTAPNPALAGSTILVLGAGDPVPDGYTGLYARLPA